jgi:hypothetical protein
MYWLSGHNIVGVHIVRGWLGGFQVGLSMILYCRAPIIAPREGVPRPRTSLRYRIAGFVARERAQQLISTLEGRLSEPEAARNAYRGGRVFSEEWNDPLISGIGSVSELV